MSSPASELLVENLHETTSRLRSWMTGLMPQFAPTGSRPRGATPEQIAGILSELVRAGQWLRSLPENKDHALERELTEYRDTVEHLRELLPLIHSTLLEERARLELERARVESAAEWARRSRQTL